MATSQAKDAGWIVCHACPKTRPTNSEKCPHCGAAKLATTKKCVACAEEIQLAAKICRYCETEQPEWAALTPAPTAKQKSRRRDLIILGVLGLFLLLAAVAVN